MKLLTKDIANRLPALYATEHIEDKTLMVKFFTPWSNWTWYGVEYDPIKKLFFGYVEGLEDEWGYFSLTELESITGMWGLKVERDIMFQPIKFSKLKG